MSLTAYQMSIPVMSRGLAVLDDYLERLLVAPVGQREDPAFPGQAYVADVFDKAVDLLEHRPQHLRVAEISVPFAGLGSNFENHREH